MKIQKNQGRGKINKWCSSWFLKEKASLTLFPLQSRPCPCPRPRPCLSGSNSKFTWWRNPRSCGLQIPLGEITFDFLAIQMESHSARVRPTPPRRDPWRLGQRPPHRASAPARPDLLQFLGSIYMQLSLPVRPPRLFFSCLCLKM